jgi:hypothetical protein
MNHLLSHDTAVTACSNSWYMFIICCHNIFVVSGLAKIIMSN